MLKLKCRICGENLEIHDNSGTCECKKCRTLQTIPAGLSDNTITLFNRANRLRNACEFDEALNVFCAISEEFPEEAEAYFGACLCRFGVRYIDDNFSDKKLPQCHRTRFESIFDDEDFKLACEYSDSQRRKIYRDEAKEIDKLQQNILEIVKSEKPYDIFICYKEKAENGERTKDSVLAQNMYEALTEKGYRVFFARISLEDKLGREFEPYIFAALNSAKIMLAVGTDFEYFNAVWVKNEWSRFLEMMKKDRTKLLIPCYADIDVYDMPREFRNFQGQNMSRVGFLQDLVRGIEKLLAPNNQRLYSENEVREIVSEAVSRAVRKCREGEPQRFLNYSEFEWDSNKIIRFKGNSECVVIPDGAVELGSSAFPLCTKLKCVTLPESLKIIGESAFESLEKLVEIEIPSGVSEIGKFAFYRCFELKNITIPESVKALGDCAFGECNSLESVSFLGFPKLGENVFKGCENLKTIYVREEYFDEFSKTAPFAGNINVEKIDG